MRRANLDTDSATSDRMARIRQRSTKPELLLRKLLWAEGIRYRCNSRSLPGSPDLANLDRGWVVFVHGCFWHGHPGCKRATVPKRNSEFWRDKIKSNRRRDASKAGALKKLGLQVFVVWECEIERVAESGDSKSLRPILSFLRRRLHRAPAS